MMQNKNIKNMTLSAMFIAIGMVLPFLTAQIPQIGNMLLPMHIPVLLCGLICGWQYGMSVGFILPIIRYVVFGMPILIPNGIAMACEMAVYGLVIGLIYNRSKWKCILSLYRAMLVSMLAGRIVWGVVRVLMMGLSSEAFSFKIFISGAFLTAMPGILLQLILIPAIMLALSKTGLIPFSTGFKKNDRAPL
ncbi:MAG: ECF transporter S component [Suipraeoptans sp.]